MTKIFHLLGGQVVIGNLVHIDEVNSLYIEDAHELMATPSENTLKGSITFVPYGSLYGMVPQLVPPQLILQTTQMVALPMDPPTEMLIEFKKATTRLVAERERIADMLKASATDITKGGTL